MTIERTFTTDYEATVTRRRLIHAGHAVSLIAYDPSRSLYVFDVYV